MTFKWPAPNPDNDPDIDSNIVFHKTGINPNIDFSTDDPFRGIFWIFSFSCSLFFTLLHLSPLRFRCVGGWLLRLWHWQPDALTTRLNLIHEICPEKWSDLDTKVTIPLALSLTWRRPWRCAWQWPWNLSWQLPNISRHNIDSAVDLDINSGSTTDIYTANGILGTWYRTWHM